MKSIIFGLAALALGWSAGAAQVYAVRGIGTIVMREESVGAAHVTRFETESTDAARRLASKRLSDILNFGDFAVRGTSPAGGTLLVDDAAGARLLGVAGATFVEAWAPAPDGFAALALAKDAPLKSVETAVYPKWLDCFDKGGPGVWIGGGGARYRLPHDFEILKELGINTFTPCKPGRSRLVEPGVVDCSLPDWAEAMAAKYDMGYRQLLFPELNTSAYTTHPLPYVTPLTNYVGLCQFLDPNQHEQGYEWPCAEIDGIQRDFLRRYMGRYGGRLGGRALGWHCATEIPGGNMLDLAAIAGTPQIQSLWNEFLAGRGKVGDGRVPVPTDFIGADSPNRLDLFAGDWQVKPRRRKSAETNEWVAARPNDPMLLMYTEHLSQKVPERSSLRFRRRFTLDAAQKGALRYFHLAAARSHNHSWSFTPVVRVNGREAAQVAPEAYFSKCFDVGPLLVEGENEIEIETYGQLVHGYALLNDVPLRAYPFMTEAQNERFFDACDFAAWLRVRKVVDDVRAVRSVDPYRPIKIMSTIEYLDLMMDVCRTYGAYQHDTGGGGAWWCPFSGMRLAMAHGVATSCEQAAPPADYYPGRGYSFIRQNMALYLNYPLDCADLVFAVEHYVPARSGKGVADWFKENVELFKAVGKFRLPETKVAVLRSTRLIRLGFRDLGDYDRKMDYDPGRGELQASGRGNYVYVETSDLANASFLDRYPVIVDIGTILLTDAECAAIRDYVLRGGTFVAQHVTGRHSATKADAHPLAKAFGIEPPAEDRRDFAFGRGRLVWLGTEKFAHDAAFYAEVLGEAGVASDSTTGDPTLWGTRYVSKNGLYDVYVASRMKPPADATNAVGRVRFARATAPAVVRDYGRKGHPAVAVEFSDGGFLTPAADYPEWETRLFVAPRAEAATDAAKDWMAHLARLWQPVQPVAWTEPDVEPPESVLPLAEGWTADDGRTVRLGLFATMGFPENERHRFTRTAKIPAAWRGRAVKLVFNAQYWYYGLLPWGEVYVDGKAQKGNPHRPQPNGSFTLDVTDAAADGEVTVEVVIDGSKGERLPANSGWAWKGDKQLTPWGASGIFYLKAEENPSRVVPIDGAWTAFVDYGQRGAAMTDAAAAYPAKYAETAFALPPEAKGCRVRLAHRTEDGLPAFVLNGHVLDLRGTLPAIDVTNFLDFGGTNVLRVVPGELSRTLGRENRRLRRPDLVLQLFK